MKVSSQTSTAKLPPGGLALLMPYIKRLRNEVKDEIGHPGD
jgi:hypothetical protein